MNDLEQVLVACTAQYDHQRQIFAQVVAEENQLRQELRRLQKLDGAVHQEDSFVSGMRVIGADLLWQGWLSRSQSTLNMQLARVLAIKSYEQERVRKAFGKVVALENLIKEEKKSRQRKVAKDTLGIAIDHALRQPPV
ncbi:hypothetical protein HKX54_12125 [Sulfitobacter sp. M57]|uniref:hypothetical protein n=1 Tax=unclassified Sulfitobacter TaxID=196795 RepID=UPI0023E1EF72|nr:MULTISPECIES: hypothetical protein [unclassified Sulfitobacter]MDF3415207.1 hypothetical protein [Sulfitobacter sp. KE5]MDF3422688.1 hypothetical protein [Sulfitobacter sp. KE43]MDF3433753.1 hypothetical protein [Sulfitobacter sp. KE42]MDF3459393.1 hypothetical protein [Sulfitobacter sp. S74]MDF3463292.1 hypothetical protein [Sulfitobacter sp. Ks18]